MLNSIDIDIYSTVIFLIAILYAVTIHEFSHAWSADLLGDSTARSQGRVTLNPLAHLDPIGLLCLLLVHFGWGKPVPVDPRAFKNPRRDDALISFAGPLSNLISAALFGMILRFAIPQLANHAEAMPRFVLRISAGFCAILCSAVIIDLILAFFNLIPLFPLDGFHVLKAFLPRQMALSYEQFSYRFPYLPFLLIIADNILRLGLLGMVIIPPVNLLSKLFTGYSFVGLNMQLGALIDLLRVV